LPYGKGPEGCDFIDLALEADAGGSGPERGQDWQTQPLAMAPRAVAEQNRAAMAS